MPAPPRSGVLNAPIKDRMPLHAAYMPFLKNGGLFVPTERPFELGDDVFLLVSLMEDPERFPITGKVVWITHRTTPGGRQAGIGIQFNGVESSNLQKKIETLLAGYVKSEQPTNTM